MKNLKDYKDYVESKYNEGGIALEELFINFQESKQELLKSEVVKIQKYLEDELNRPRFRSSSIGGLNTQPKLKRDREKGLLAKTVFTMVEDLWLEKNYGFKKVMDVNQTRKGIMCEAEAIGLVQWHEKQFGKPTGFRIKNEVRMYGRYNCGTADIVLPGQIEDIKVAYDVRNFMRKGREEFYTRSDGKKIWGFNKLQYGQAQDYMRLWGKKKFVLVYCAVKTPEELIRDEEKRVFYKYGNDEEHEEYVKQSKQIRINHNFEKIPIKERVKKIEIEWDEDWMKSIKENEKKAMKYYESIKRI